MLCCFLLQVQFNVIFLNTYTNITNLFQFSDSPKIKVIDISKDIS